MKRLVLAGIGALAVVTAMDSANAADIARRQAMPTKAAYVQAYNWTGAYVGINVGGGFGNSIWTAPGGSTGFNVAGGVVGGTLGYNYQMGQAVFGLEGDLDWSNIHGNTSNGICVGVTCETHNNWLATARGRVGYAFDRFMPFITGGAAFGDEQRLDQLLEPHVHFARQRTYMLVLTQTAQIQRTQCNVR